MNKKFIALVLFISALLVFVSPVLAAGSYPEPTSRFYVNDFANVLSEETENNIASLGRQLEDKTGAQVVVVTVDTLDGEDIESYSIGLASKWAIGQKDKDNGILVLNAVEERMLRIEVGYGLEGAVPDIKTAEIREQYMNPYLKNNDYDSGIYNGYGAIVENVAKEYGAQIDETGRPSKSYGENAARSRANKRGFNFFPILAVLFLIADGVLFRFRITSTLIRIAFWMGMFRGPRGGGGGRGGSWGGGSGGGSSGGGGRFGGGGSSGGY